MKRSPLKLTAEEYDALIDAVQLAGSEWEGIPSERKLPALGSALAKILKSDTGPVAQAVDRLI
jgi:hypothetical protein